MDETRTTVPSRPKPGHRQWGFGTISLVVVLFGILAGALWYAARAWTSVEGPPMPASGYIFMTLGVVLSLSVGFGLMGLIFYSSRYGYDDRSIDERPRISSAPGDDRD
ncbi:MAG: hypothetical protein WA776_15350 [Xanthobacteraceae bacterium]